MANFTSAIALLKKPIDDLYEQASGAVKDKISRIRASEKVKDIHKRLYELQRVKTIWQTDKPIILSTFFYPVRVAGANGSASQQINSLDDFPENNIIIFGTVGQGKSMLMRYLLGKEIKSGCRVPLFCELRNVGKGDFEEWLAKRFCSFLGVEESLDLFRYFSSGGKISFMLDGFDEIDPEDVQRLNFEIGELSSKYPNCRIVLTSRPDSECKYQPNFYSYKICPLSEYDLFGFYKKISKDDSFSNGLVGAIKSSPLQIKKLIDTPLLATLLAISYRSAHKIPLHFSEFYDDLFQILITRHDAIKLGWRRPRSSKLDDRQMQQAFEAFCFATRRERLSSLEKNKAEELAKDSLKEADCLASPLSFLDDIRKITCLLVLEDKKYGFVHNSVQEFFCSRYVKTRPEKLAEAIYQQLLGGKWSEWGSELLFLKQIDTYRFEKYFYIPEMKIFSEKFKGGHASLEDAARDYLNSLVIRKRRTNKGDYSYYVYKLRSWNTYSSFLLDQRIYSLLFSGSFGKKGWAIGFNNSIDQEERTYVQIVQDKEAPIDELVKIILAFFSNLQDEIKMGEKRILEGENVSPFIVLI